MNDLELNKRQIASVLDVFWQLLEFNPDIDDNDSSEQLQKEKNSIDEMKSTEQDDEAGDRDYFRTKNSKVEKRKSSKNQEGLDCRDVFFGLFI